MFKRLAVVVAAAAAILPFTAGTASASSSYYLYYGGVYVAYGEFQSYGDHWTVCDMNSDGRGAVLFWSVPSTGRTDSLRDTDGYNSSCATQNVNIGEGRTVAYYVCLLNNGSVLGYTCGPTKYDTA
jgi:hypothetical protein